MARNAIARRCNVCGAFPLYWKNVQGPRGNSIRLIDPVTGTIHPSASCNAKAQENARFNPPVIAEQPPEHEIDVTPQAKEPHATPASNAPETGNDALFGLIRPNVERAIADAIQGMDSSKMSVVVHEVNVTRADGAEVKIDSAHKMLPTLLKYLSLKLNVLLVGPAGSGKTHAAHECAKALGLDYYPMSVGPQTSKSDLLGYMDAHGKLVRTVLRDAFENGGVFLLDEFDAGNPGVLTVLNALLANSVCSFPDGVITKHPDFVCIAAANTFGQGANLEYTGRQRLDAASLNRFVGIYWDYDTDLEARMSVGQEDWCMFVWALRKSAERNGIKRVFGTRSIIYGKRMLDAGIALSETKDATVFFGVPTDERLKLERNL